MLPQLYQIERHFKSTLQRLEDHLSGEAIQVAPQRIAHARPRSPFAPEPEPQRPQRVRRLPAYLEDYEVEMPAIDDNVLDDGAIGRGDGDEDDQPDDDENALEFDNKLFLWASTHFAVTKITSYIDLLQNHPIYNIAILLHPGRRAKWFRSYKPDREGIAIQMLRKFCNAFYNAPIEAPVTPQEQQVLDHIEDDQLEDGFFDEAVESLDGEIDRQGCLFYNNCIQVTNILPISDSS